MMISYLIIIAGLGVSDVVLVRVGVPGLEAGCDGGQEKEESREHVVTDQVHRPHCTETDPVTPLQSSPPQTAGLFTWKEN